MLMGPFGRSPHHVECGRPSTTFGENKLAQSTFEAIFGRNMLSSRLVLRKMTLEVDGHSRIESTFPRAEMKPRVSEPVKERPSTNTPPGKVVPAAVAKRQQVS